MALSDAVGDGVVALVGMAVIATGISVVGAEDASVVGEDVIVVGVGSPVGELDGLSSNGT